MSRYLALRQGRLGRELDQIPAVAVEIREHRDGAIRRLRWLAHEYHTLSTHCVIVAPEVVGAEEEPHPSTGLVANACRLLRRRGPCQQ